MHTKLVTYTVIDFLPSQLARIISFPPSSTAGLMVVLLKEYQNWQLTLIMSIERYKNKATSQLY